MISRFLVQIIEWIIVPLAKIRPTETERFGGDEEK